MDNLKGDLVNKHDEEFELGDDEKAFTEGYEFADEDGINLQQVVSYYLVKYAESQSYVSRVSILRMFFNFTYSKTEVKAPKRETGAEYTRLFFKDEFEEEIDINDSKVRLHRNDIEYFKRRHYVSALEDGVADVLKKLDAAGLIVMKTVGDDSLIEANQGDGARLV